MSISDEAIESAAKAFLQIVRPSHPNWDEWTEDGREMFKSQASQILEAAAPFIAAEAFHRGYVAALDQAAENLDTLWYERKERMYQQRDWADGVEESETLVKKMAAGLRDAEAS